jgi:hypothetical protein
MRVPLVGRGRTSKQQSALPVVRDRTHVLRSGGFGRHTRVTMSSGDVVTMSSAVCRAGPRGGAAKPRREILGQRRGGSRRSVRHQSRVPSNGFRLEPRDRRVVVLLDAPARAAAAIRRGCRGLPCSCVGGTGAPQGLGWALGERTRGHPNRVSGRSGPRVLLADSGPGRPSRTAVRHDPVGGVEGGGRHGGQQGPTGGVRGGVEQLGRRWRTSRRGLAGSTTGSAGARAGGSAGPPR